MFDDLLSGLTDNVGTLADTATTFGSGAIASAISGNPLYSNDPAAAGYAVAGAATAKAGNSNLLVLLVIGYLIFKFAK